MADPVFGEQRYKDGLDYAKMATSYDQRGHYTAAMTHYLEAAEALHQACQLAPFFEPILPQVKEYTDRAQQIREHLSKNKGAQQPTPLNSLTRQSSRDKAIMHQLEYLMEVSMVFDEEKRWNEAECTYTSVMNLAIKAKDEVTTDEEKTKIKTTMKMALKRLEQIKQEKEKLFSFPEPPKGLPNDEEDKSLIPEQGKTKPPPYNPAYQNRPRLPLTSFLEADMDKPVQFNAYSPSNTSPSSTRSSSTSSSTTRSTGGSTVGASKPKGEGDRFSEKEIKILRTSSTINGIVYLPWSDSDLSELRTVSALPMDYCDPDGILELSDKQKAHLGGWARPGELVENPKIAHLISSISIKQTLIGDCSFLASLGVCADYERRFKKKLVTKCIYPRNRHGDPIINPNGKYFIALYLNGRRRKIVIDDRLPVDAYSNLLCSYSHVRDEFWVSLLEKGYMKVMGGYDFPGSSSNNDLHALTGWIPERIDMGDKDGKLDKEEMDDKDRKFDKEKTYKMIEKKMKKGYALITMGTGDVDKAEPDRTGLVPRHAYAVLQITHVQGRDMLQLKNPWSEKRWKGNYSENDHVNWTPALKKALNYDQTKAAEQDDGVFWIDWAAVCKYYETLYINWNPDMFPIKYTLHDYWKPSEVSRDVYNISNNPQYSLHVNCTEAQSAAVWILLSRHITTKSDFADNEKFITVHVAPSKGQRLYLPPLKQEEYVHQGIKINTPHYLAKLDPPVPHGNHSYTVIVSQLESLSTIYYTIKVYASCPFKFGPVPALYHHTKELKGDWTISRPKPSFKLTLPCSISNVLLQLKGPKKYYVWMYIKSSGSSGDGSLKKDSGPARPGFTVLEVGSVPSGEYTVTAQTYTDNQEGPFFISASCNNVFNFEPIR